MADVDVRGGVVDAVVNFVVRGAQQAIEGPRNVRDAERAALLAAGYQYGRWAGANTPPSPPPDKGKWVPVWYDPRTGRTFGRDEAVRIAGQLRAAANQPRPPTPDVATPPLIPSIPLPSIPPLLGGVVRALPWPVLGGPIVAGGFMWPTAAGTGSDLRDLYGMPKPKAAPGRRGRGRRRRARARPRAQPGRGNPFPAAVPGRGGPVTIRTRPGTAAPPAARVVSPAWKPSKANLPPVKIPKQVIKAAPPARVPMTRTQTVIAKAGAIAKSPWFNVASTILGSPLFSLFQPRARAPSLGNIQLPGTGLSPGINPNPLTALNPAALPYAAFARAPAAVQEQDCSCRPARKKRKGKPCKNPVTSRRSFKRDGSQFITVTRRVKCQASSRKKPRLRPVP